MTEDEQFAHFETLGEAQVRDFAPQWQGPVQGRAYKWLRQKDQESRLRSEFSNSEQIEIARSAKDAAWAAARAAERSAKHAQMANIIAIIALIIAIGSIGRSFLQH